MLLSICIPTFNRSECLNNCLNSILISSKNCQNKFEVCIRYTKKCGGYNHKFKSKINIKFNKNYKNLVMEEIF